MPQREGYLLVDHRGSPGLPEDIARASGFNPTEVKEGKLFESATLTCAHCKVVVVRRPERIRERASCMKCGGKYICDGCAVAARMPDYSHMPFEKEWNYWAELATKAPQLGSPPCLLMKG